jgi:glucosamine--fructose-6-phosphate aminotransferase (isomerizing)
MSEIVQSDNSNDNGQRLRSYMLREIYEQPEALERTIRAHMSADGLLGTLLDPLEATVRNARRIVIAASGSSRHAGLAGEIMLEDMADIRVDVEYASEFECRTSVGPIATVVVISQSGETSDTVAAQRTARDLNAQTIAIANVKHSTLALEATVPVYTHAGPELSIPATKSFTSQLAVLYMLALHLARKRNPGAVDDNIASLTQVPSAIEACLGDWDASMAECAARYKDAPGFLFVGRAIHYAIAREGALKVKETSYVHAEGYPTGELLHGPQALVDENLPVVAIVTCDRQDPDSVMRYEKSLAVLEKIKSEGGKLIALATEDCKDIRRFSDHVIFIPRTPELLLPLVEVVPLQLFAYHIATMKGYDVDRPRNLVKAVVE